MAWRPNDLITEGAIAFDHDGAVRGVLHFNGLDRPVKLDLAGCPAHVRGTRLTFRATHARAARHLSAHDVRPAAEYMRGFALLQRGTFSDLRIDGSQLTLVWYSAANRRVCIEFQAAFEHEPLTAAPPSRP